MNSQSWTLEQLKSQLSSRKEVKSWIIIQEHTHRRERYFMSEKDELIIDQDRNIHTREISLKLFVTLTESESQGEVTKKLFSSLPLQPQIDQAIESALETNHQTWSFPTDMSKKLKTLATSDPKMAEDIEQVMKELTSKIEIAVKKKRTSKFNSAELFLSSHDRELHLSNGLIHRTSQSRIYAETAFSFSRTLPHQKIESDEYLNTQWAVHLDQLSIDKLFDDASERAECSLDVEKPITGKYPVIIHAEVLSHLLNGQISQLSASNRYHGLPFIEVGEEFIPNAKNDLLSLTLDPTLNYGANTIAVSEQGLPQSPLKLVNKNQVIATATNKQYGDYLKKNPTSTYGNLVVDEGQLSHQELSQQHPYVIEILQFSGLFSDPNSGTFSSEIRLAKLYDNKNGTIRHIKGGSLSGSIAENFREIRLSKSKVNWAYFSSESAYGQGYYGPEYALLGNVSIVG